MSIHPSMGDARIVLSSILDYFNEVANYLRRAYVTTHSFNFYRATKHFFELCSPQKSNKNDFVCLRNIEIAAKQVIQGHKIRKAYRLNEKKNTEDTVMELLLLISFSV